MNVGENDDGSNYNFFGAQFNYTLETSLGEGHYRVGCHMTSSDFLDPEGIDDEGLSAFYLSCDQSIGEIFGAWVRVAFGSDDALVDYEAMYSGGINISGNWWGREQDAIGVGLAYLDGTGQTEEQPGDTQVAEAYARFGLNDFLAVTFDLQYMKDNYRGGEDVDGWIGGARAVCEF
jgi:porin